MKKSKFNYFDLSKKELEYLKEFYVTQKVGQMNESELRKFVHENISHQVKNTIGDEEEQEAWDEIENFFNEEFESLLEGIKKKFEASNQNLKIENKTNSTETMKKIENENEKIDMWMD